MPAVMKLPQYVDVGDLLVTSETVVDADWKIDDTGYQYVVFTVADGRQETWPADKTVTLTGPIQRLPTAVVPGDVQICFRIVYRVYRIGTEIWLNDHSFDPAVTVRVDREVADVDTGVAI